MWWWQDSGGRTIYRYVRNDIVRSASLPHRVLVKRNCTYQCIATLGIYHPTGKGRGFDRYMKSIASPLEQILGSNAPIIGLCIPPDPGHIYTIKSPPFASAGQYIDRCIIIHVIG